MLMRTIRVLGLLGTLSLSGMVSAAEPPQLLIWINSDKGYNGLDKLAQAFAKKSGVKVVVEHPEDATTKFQLAAAAGKGPDIFFWAHDRMGEWASAGLLQPVTPRSAIKAGIDDKAWQAFTLQNKIWGYPISIESVSLIVNKDLLSKAPTTWEEIPALDASLMKKGKKAILWDYNTVYYSWGLMAATGAYPFKRTANGEHDPKDVGINNEGMQRGMAYLLSLINGGVMPKSVSYADAEAAFNRGDVAMTISGPWAWDNLKKSGIRYEVAKLPSLAGKPSAPMVGYTGAMISAASKNQDLAVEFLETAVLSPAGLKQINADVPLGLPANKALYQELSKTDARLNASMANASAGQPMPNIAEMGKFWTITGAAFQNITSGRQNLKEGLATAERRLLK